MCSMKHDVISEIRNIAPNAIANSIDATEILIIYQNVVLIYYSLSSVIYNQAVREF